MVGLPVFSSIIHLLHIIKKYIYSKSDKGIGKSDIKIPLQFSYNCAGSGRHNIYEMFVAERFVIGKPGTSSEDSVEQRTCTMRWKYGAHSSARLHDVALPTMPCEQSNGQKNVEWFHLCVKGRKQHHSGLFTLTKNDTDMQRSSKHTHRP